MLPMTRRLRRTKIAYGTSSFKKFAERSTADSRQVVRERLMELRTLQHSNAIALEGKGDSDDRLF